MPRKKVSRKKFSYATPRYWYHLSSTLKKNKEYLTPWGSERSQNRCHTEPEGRRICVAPTIEQCLTALPYFLVDKYNIYRTARKITVTAPRKIFDSNVTNEGWVTKPTTFIKLGRIRFVDVEKGLKATNVIEQAASENNPSLSGKVLKWWQRAKIERFIKKT